MKKILIIIILAILTALLLIFYYPREDNEISSISVNKEVEIQEEIETLDNLSLDIAFQSQAPMQNWDMPWQEACEEASLILAVNYLRGETTITAEQMNEKILTLVEWQEKNWGGHHDLSMAQLEEMVEKFYGQEIEVEIVEDFSWDDVKLALNQGYPIIVPAAGQQLGNPNFTAPGPVYHMLVIRGYTSDKVLTNDVGTRLGENYAYDYDVLYDAIHDWNNGQVEQGEKVIMIVK